jgi:pSer/pThr/pTyr-binding forkhead associated (FHA) protein
VLVAELRHALRDRPGAAGCIRTVRGFGYAFSAKVSGEVQDFSPPRQCWLIFKGREIALHEGDNVIGRDQGAAVRLDLPSVSRRHARICVSSGEAVVEDLGSKNGTFLRQNRITAPSRLADLDELQIGSARLVVRILKSAADTETLAP